jgi:hypothetical protein
VVSKSQELGIAHERAAFEPQVPRDNRLHLIEEQLLRHAAEIDERLLESVIECRHVLARVEPTPQQSRVAEHDEQRIPHAPRKPESREVHLCLTPGRRFEADHRRRRRRRPHASNERFQL